MFLHTNHNHHIFPTAAAAEAFVAGQDEDDDFTYKVSIDPKGSGRAVVEVYDEDGEFISLF